MEKKPDFKSMPPKSKLQYIWDYYRWQIVIAICILAFAFSLIRHYVTYREPLLDVLMINSPSSFSADSSAFDEFLEEYGYEVYDEAVSLNASLSFYDKSSSMNDQMVLSTLLSAGGEDLFFGTGEVFENYAEQGAMMDLSKLLPAETLEKYKDRLLYSTDNGSADPYPCAILLTENRWLTENSFYDNCYFSIVAQTDNPEICADFAEFLLNY